MKKKEVTQYETYRGKKSIIMYHLIVDTFIM